METVEERLTTPITAHAQVLVVGGGIAGVAAAVAARRQGAQVLLLEQTALLGGLATGGLISWYEPLCDGQGTQLMYGLPEELLRLAIRYGPDTLPKLWQGSGPVDRRLVRPEKQHPIGGRYGSYFSPTLFQLALDELLRQEGVDIRLCISGVRPLMGEGNHCLGVVTESASGREAISADVVVDATGDATVLHRAGVPCESGENYFSFVAQAMDTRAVESVISRRKWVMLGASLYGEGQPEGEPLVPGTTNQQVTDFLLKGRAELLARIRSQDRFSRDITALPTQAQFRKIRRLCGAATLTEADRNQPHTHSVALLSDFDRPGDWYELPYGCLYHPEFPNLLAAGRMVSADGWAWDVTRVIPACAATGQAAGVAAAMAARTGRDVRALDIAAVQSCLRQQGVLLHRADVQEKEVAP